MAEAPSCDPAWHRGSGNWLTNKARAHPGGATGPVGSFSTKLSVCPLVSHGADVGPELSTVVS
jgi:hypothetical protein